MNNFTFVIINVLIFFFIAELQGKYILVRIEQNDSHERSLDENGDWLSFHVNDTFESFEKYDIRYIGDPKLHWTNWDYGTLATSPGPHMICDINGRGLKLSEVKHGMQVKIKAKNIHHPTPPYEWLYSSQAVSGKAYYDYAESTGKDKQIWKVLKDHSKGDSSICFESVYWPGYYLTHYHTGARWFPWPHKFLCTNCYSYFDPDQPGDPWKRGKHQTWWEASISSS